MKVTPCGALKCARFARANSRSSLFIGARALLENNEGVRRFAPALMRQADDRHFLHGGMTQQHAFDLDRGDVFAAADDDVFQAIANLDIAIRMNDRGIAGVKPSAAQRLRGRLRDRCSSRP